MLARGRAPEYTLNGQYSFGTANDSKVLESGTFLRPILRQYLPVHVKDDPRWRYFMPDNDYEFCYTRYGIIPVPKKQIMERS